MSTVLGMGNQATQIELTNFLQRDQVGLGIYLCRFQGDVAEMFGNILERESFRQQMGGAGMPKSMGPIAW